MRNETDAKEDSTARVSAVPWRVASVRALPGHSLWVVFADGTSGRVDVSKLIFGANSGVFEVLRNPGVFEQVGVVLGTVTWPGELDLAPDTMYDALKANGGWTPQ